MYGDIKDMSQCNDSPYFRARPHFCGLQNNGFKAPTQDRLFLKHHRKSGNIQ